MPPLESALNRGEDDPCTLGCTPDDAHAAQHSLIRDGGHQQMLHESFDHTGRQRRFRLPIDNKHRQAMDGRPQPGRPTAWSQAGLNPRWPWLAGPYVFFISAPGAID